MQNFISSSDLLCWNIVLKGNSAKSLTTDNDGNLKIRPSVTVKEHQQVQREEKARTILLSALPNEHMGDFYHMIDARDIWNAIKARFGGLEYISFDDLYNKLKFLDIDTKGYLSSSSTLSNVAFVSTARSSQGNLSYQESGNSGYTTTLSVSLGSSSSKGSSKSKCSVVNDVIYSFFANPKIGQHLVYEDLDQMNKEEFEEYDLKHQMAMLSIKVHRFEKKHRQNIKFNGRENARFDKKLVKCFNCKQMGHFSRECRAQSGQNSNNYQKYKSNEAGKDGSDLKAMVVVDGKADSEGEVVSADNTIPAGVSISTGDVAATVVSPQSETEFALMGLSTELADEEKIRVLSYELEEKSNILEYRKKLIDQAVQEKQDLMTKLDNEIANQAKWNNSGKNLYKLIDISMSVRTKRGLGLDKYIGEGELGIDDSKFSIFHTNSDELEGQPIYNRFASVDHMKVVPPLLIGNYMPPSNILDVDESQMVYGKRPLTHLKSRLMMTSIAKSDYCGVANAVVETCWLQNLLRKVHTYLSSATLVYYDNVSDVYLSSNLVQDQHTKHIEIHIHFVRDLFVVG
nr:ribonuclease H-like domain-containing protein [Tanacetum cinerariifolium]